MPIEFWIGMTQLRALSASAAAVLRRHRRHSLTLLALCCVLHPGAAFAQHMDRTSPPIQVSSQAGDSPLRLARFSIPVETPKPLRSLQPPRTRDPLKNGVIVGAAVGAAVFGALAAIVCRAYQEEGGPSCVDDTVRFAAIGAAIGSGVGLAIDVARDQRAGVAVRLAVKF